jgi:hypothetical protein
VSRYLPLQRRLKSSRRSHAARSINTSGRAASRTASHKVSAGDRANEVNEQPDRDGRSKYDDQGIGLFLARLAHITRDPIIRTTAEGALAQALIAEEALASGGECGFYSGPCGIAWACREAGRVLEHEALMARGEAALLAAARIAPNRQRIDVINQAPGLSRS